MTKYYGTLHSILQKKKRKEAGANKNGVGIGIKVYGTPLWRVSMISHPVSCRHILNYGVIERRRFPSFSVTITFLST